jgi:hypothetical protein
MALSFTTRIGTAVNLPQGATYDLLMLSYVDGFPQSQLIFEIPETPRKVTGIQKVAQVFLKILFTRKGADVIYPTTGTYFSDYTINANRVDQNDTTFASDLTEQINDAVSQTQFILNLTSSDAASQLQSVTLLGLDATQQSVVMYLQILTMAGQGASISIPFPELDMPLSDQIGS